MGQVGKTVFQAVCNIVYGGIKSIIPKKEDEEIGIKGLDDPSISENPAITGEPPTTSDVEEEKPKDAAKEEEEEKEEEKEEARDITNQQATTARKAAYQAAINAGVTPAQAQAAADAQTPVGNYAGNYAALSNAGANARAAYRERQGYADALAREARNLEEARKREIANAALQGAGAGAQTGLSLFGNSGGE